MKTTADKSSEPQHQAVTHEPAHQQGRSRVGVKFIDNRADTANLRQLQIVIDDSPRMRNLTQLKAIMSDNLRSAAMQYLHAIVDNSPRRVVQRQQYSRVLGTSIKLQAGLSDAVLQRSHEPVQQVQGNVRPTTMRIKGKVSVNDDAGLEKEADVREARALQMKPQEDKSEAVDNLYRHSNKPVFQLVRSVGSHKALDKGHIRDSNAGWNSFETFPMDVELIIVNNNESVWQGVNHVWGHTATNGVDGWINENKVSKDAPDLADILWSRARKGVVYVNDIFVNLGYNLGLVAAQAEPWYINADTPEENTKHYARHLMNGQESAPGDFTADAAYDADLQAVMANNLFLNQMIAGEIARTGTPAAANVIGGVNNPSGMLSRAAEHFENIVTTPVPPIATENVSKVDPVSYMDHGTSITRGTGATEGVLLHEMGHHLENNLDPAEFATIHNFIRARSEDDGQGAPRMKGVGYGKLSGGKTAGQGYDTLPMDYNIKDMNGLGFKSHLAKLGIKKSFKWNSDATKTSAKREIEDSMLSWGNSNDVSYYTQSDDGSFATEFLSTSIEFFAKGTTVQQMIAADPLRVALLLFVANRPQYILIRDALQAKFYLPIPAPGMNYMLDNLIHKVSV